jgi:hypothetical protein
MTFTELFNWVSGFVFVCSVIYALLPPLEEIEKRFGPSPRYWLFVTLLGKVGALNVRADVMKYYASFKNGNGLPKSENGGK